MEEPADLRSSLPSLVRVALAVLVLAWILGPDVVRSAAPIWLVFLIALGLEVQFLVGAFRPGRVRRPDRSPQAVDRQRFGYDGDADELVPADSDDSDVELGDVTAEGRPLWAPVRRFVTGIGVIGALALVLWVVESRTGWDALASDVRAEAAARFSQEASRIAGKPVTIGCDESRDYVGVVQHADGVAAVGGDHAYLTPERCLDLYRLAFEGEVTSSQTARALAVLAHEAWHLRGVSDEGTTECYALQSGVELGRRLSLSEGTARRLMRLELTENALHRGPSFEYLVPPDCRERGRLDLTPNDGRFP